MWYDRSVLRYKHVAVPADVNSGVRDRHCGCEHVLQAIGSLLTLGKNMWIQAKVHRKSNNLNKRPPNHVNPPEEPNAGRASSTSGDSAVQVLFHWPTAARSAQAPPLFLPWPLPGNRVTWRVFNLSCPVSQAVS